MSRTLVKLSGLQPGGIGLNTQLLPANIDILGLAIVLTSGAAAIGDFGLIQLFGNTEALHEYANGAELDDINGYDLANKYGVNSILELPLERLGMLEQGARYGATLKINPPDNGNNTGDGKGVALGLPAGTPVFTTGNLQFTVLNTATAPTFDVYAEVERSIDKSTGAGPVMRRKRYTETLSGTSEQGFARWKFGSEQFRYIRRVFLKNAGGTIDKMRVTADGKEVFNRPRLLNNDMIKRYNLHDVTAAGGWQYMIDFTENGQREDFDTLGLGELEWHVTPSASGALVAMVEYGGTAW